MGPGQSGSEVTTPAGAGRRSCARDIPPGCTPLQFQISLVCLVMSDGHRREATQQWASAAGQRSGKEKVLWLQEI